MRSGGASGTRPALDEVDARLRRSITTPKLESVATQHVRLNPLRGTGRRVGQGNKLGGLAENPSLVGGIDEGYDGNRTTLIGAGRPATAEEVVLYLAESQEMTDEEHDDPERVLAMLRRYGCDVVWDYDTDRAVPRPRDVSP